MYQGFFLVLLRSKTWAGWRTRRVTALFEPALEQQLKESDFVESLINTIILKTNNHRNINSKGIKKLLLALEDLRLDLEYKTPKGDSPEC